MANAITSLRIVDPKLERHTLEDYGVAYTIIAPLEITLLVVLPPFVARGKIVESGLVLTGLSVGCLLLSRLLVGWFPSSPTAVRAGEDLATRDSSLH